jgi:hypothetical protein
MIDRVLSLVVAVSLAFLVWLYAASRDQEILDNVPVPVHITLAPGQAEHYDLEITGPSQVTVSFTGPPSRIRELRGLLQRGQIQVEMPLTVPEEREQESRFLDTVLVTPRDVRTPPGVTPVVVEGRNRIPVTLRRVVERHLPVRLNCSPEDRIAQVAIEPPTALVRGPQEVLDQARTLPTEPFPLPAQSEAPVGQETVVNGVATLARELEGHAVRVSPAAVAVRLTLKPRQKLYVLNDVPVHFLCPANFTLRPLFVGNERGGRTMVHVTGPAGEEPPAVVAFIDLTQRKFTPGLYADEPLQVQLPKDFRLAQTPPRSAAFRLLELPPAPARETGQGGGNGL